MREIRHTYEEFLRFEASSNVKHEFLDGQIYAMAGGTPEHAALAGAVIGLLVRETGATKVALVAPECSESGTPYLMNSISR